MKLQELYEGATPKLPGASKGIKIMTPQQFVAKSAEGEEPEPDEVDENLSRRGFLTGMGAAALGAAGAAKAQTSMKPLTPGVERGHIEGVPALKYQDKIYRFAKGQQGPKEGIVLTVPAGSIGIRGGHSVDVVLGQDGLYYVYRHDVDEGWIGPALGAAAGAYMGGPQGALIGAVSVPLITKFIKSALGHQNTKEQQFLQQFPGIEDYVIDKVIQSWPKDKFGALEWAYGASDFEERSNKLDKSINQAVDNYFLSKYNKEQAYAYSKKYGDRLNWYFYSKVQEARNKFNEKYEQELKKLKEATKLPAPTRPIGDPELTDYLDRIRNQQKLKTDKYKLPYIHRSSVVSYYNEEGKKYNVDAIKAALKERPKKLLKQNEKMKHSNGELEQFYNIGFAALVGIALDENTNELIIVNTCPGAGSCKVDCFAMKGGKVQFQGPWLSDGRILTYLLNDPEGFFSQLDSEIKKEEKKGDKGGYSVSIRWHDAGDFFSPEYVAMAFKLAENNPDVSFYAYTKVSDVAMGDKPGNFMINWSEGASSREEKKVKAADPSLTKTKNSRIVPSDLFYDLLVKDEKKNLVKGPEGQWQVIPDKLPELKQRLAKAYQLSPNSILSYSEWENKFKGKEGSPLQYNVIITPGEPDLTAKDPGVLSTLLLKH